MSLNTYPYNPFPASTDKLDEAHNAELQQEVDQLKEDTGELQEDVEKLETDKTDTAVIAPEFDAEAGVYAVGDLVMYQGKLYEFTTAHETAGEWDSTEVTEKTVADEIDSVKSGLTNKQNDLSLGVMIDNLNNAGIGCCNYDENATNAPDTSTGIVVTFRNTWNNMVFGLQIAYTRGTPQKVFIRHEWNGGYGQWKEIALS